LPAVTTVIIITANKIENPYIHPYPQPCETTPSTTEAAAAAHRILIKGSSNIYTIISHNVFGGLITGSFLLYFFILSFLSSADADIPV
jgi:hypothetical protein